MLLLAIGCTPGWQPPAQTLATPTLDPSGGTATDDRVVDEFVEPNQNAMDFLFVIENTVWMLQHQSTLDAFYPDVMTWLLDSELDFHVGVVTADLDDSGELVAGSSTRWINNDTEYPTEVFTAITDVGASGVAGVAGLGTVFGALGKNAPSNNFGFRRPDAGLHTIAIAGRDDDTATSEISPSEFIAWYEKFVPPPHSSSFSAIVPTSGFSPADTFLAVVDNIGGATIDIDDDDPHDLLPALTNLIGEPVSVPYPLSEAPVVDSIEVVVTLGEAQLATDPWTFDEFYNTVQFDEGPPPGGAIIRISYLPVQ